MDSGFYLHDLNGISSFTRNDLRAAMDGCGMQVSEASLKVKLQWLLTSGEIVRVGRNAYCVADGGLHKYRHDYSELSENVSSMIQENHPHLDFTVFELVQLNEFVNHLLAHNILFVSVESDLCNFIFDTLKSAYQGKVLLNPDVDTFHQYWSSDMILIRRMVTESPRDREKPWAVKLEKLLVDIVAEPLVAASVSESEYPDIFRNAFEKYAVDESCMFRYARRRGADRKIRQLIAQGGTQLRRK